MTEVKYAFGCCFCGTEISPPQVPKGIMLQWGEEDNEWQQWWCHLDCFVESISEQARCFAWEDDEELII